MLDFTAETTLAWLLLHTESGAVDVVLLIGSNTKQQPNNSQLKKK